MPAIVLYLLVTAAIVAAWRRFVQPVTLAAAIAVVLLPLCFTGRALLTGRVYAPIDLPYMSEPLKDYARDYGTDHVYNGTLSDLYMQMIPWQSAVRESLYRGEWPLWNPHMLNGSILAANMQSTVYDPLHLVALLLSHPQALTFNAAMTLFLAAFFAFAFARRLGIGEVPALITAAAYAFCGPIAFYVEWPLGRTWALLPLLLYGVRGVTREPGTRAAVILALAFVLIIVAGHPESVLHIVTVGAIYGAYEIVLRARESREAALRAIGLAAICGVVALLLTAVLLLPFAEAVPQSGEYHARHAFLANAPVRSSMETVTRRAMLSLFPWYAGQPERDNFVAGWEPQNVRLGSVVLALALLAPFVARRRDTWFFAGLAAFCTLAAFTAWPVAHLLHALPLFDIAVNDRLQFPAAFCVALLAGMAVDWLWDTGRPAAGVTAGRRPALRVAAVVMLLGAALLAGTLVLRSARIAAGVDPDLLTTLAAAELASVFALSLLLAFRTPSRIALPAVLALVLLQRTLVDGAMYPTLPARAFYPDLPILRAMQNDRSGPFRMVGLHYAFLPDAAALYGLEDARGYEAMTLRWLSDTYKIWSTPIDASFNRVSEKNAPFLSFLNVKYAIGSRREQPDEQWKLVLEDRDSRLFENTRVLPRAFVPRRVRYEQDREAVLTGMALLDDFREKAWILTPEYPPHDVQNGPGTLALRREGTTYAIDAHMESAGWVVVSESSWRGWRAYIDGRRVRPHYANSSFLGVYVPAGTHAVRLEYLPTSFVRGRNISLATLAALAAYFALRRHRLQKPRAV